MNWKAIDCDFTYEGSSYGAMGDVHVRTEIRDVGPEGFRPHVYAHCPCEASVDNLQVFSELGDRLATITPEVAFAAKAALEDKAAMLTWEIA